MRLIAGKDEGVALRIISALQLLVSIGFWVLYFYLSATRPGGAPAALKTITGPFFHNDISDPVLHILVLILTGGIAICFIPAIFLVMLYLLAFLIALGIMGGLLQLLISLGRVSITGAIVAGLISLAALYGVFLLIRELLWPKLRPYVQPAVDAIYGLFFDWWITPILKHRKEKRMMDDLRRKRSQCEAVVLQLQAEDPQPIADMGLGSLRSDDTWLERMIERFVDRDRQKNIAERTKLIGLAKQYFSEYRAMLAAHNELTLAPEDAKIRRLQREKEQLELKNQLADLQHVAATRGELRPMEAEKQKLTLQHELEQLKKKVAGGENGPYREGMRDKRARRMVDIEDDLFEALEHPIQTEMDARVLYKKLRQKIDRHPDLTDEDKDEMLERLKQRFGQLFKHASTPIFEED